jgi:hypothetical protein
MFLQRNIRMTKNLVLRMDYLSPSKNEILRLRFAPAQNDELDLVENRTRCKKWAENPQILWLCAVFLE